MEIAIGYQIFLTELIKSPICCVDKFSEMCDSKKKKKKKVEILTIVEFFWIITHNSQRIILLGVSMVKGQCKIKQKTEQIERWE